MILFLLQISITCFMSLMFIIKYFNKILMFKIWSSFHLNYKLWKNMNHCFSLHKQCMWVPILLCCLLYSHRWKFMIYYHSSIMFSEMNSQNIWNPRELLAQGCWFSQQCWANPLEDWKNMRECCKNWKDTLKNSIPTGVIPKDQWQSSKILLWVCFLRIWSKCKSFMFYSLPALLQEGRKNWNYKY